jgi:hypothetical protein
MQTVRRLYVYLLSGVSLGVLLYGLASLLEALFGAIGLSHQQDVYRSGGWESERLSLALALIGVGAPVWGIHWWLAQRSLAPGRGGAEEERASALRALYLSVVLVALLVWGASSALALGREAVAALMSAPRPDYYGGSGSAAASAALLVSALAWAYHVLVRRRDLARGALSGAAAWLPRLYVYGIAFAALAAALQTTGELLRLAGEAIWPVPTYGDEGYRAYHLAETISGVVVWSIAWLGHWGYSGRLIAAGGWRAVSERDSRLRLAFFVAVLLAGTAGVLGLLGEAGSTLLRAALGATSPILDPAGSVVPDNETLRLVTVALASAVPWAVAWWFHRGRLHREALESDDPHRPALAVRLDLHAVSLVGLAFGAVGAGWLVGLGVDAVLGGTRGRDGWELAEFVPMTVLGLAVWAWRWLPIRARYAADPDGESASTIRRAFLLLILAGSVIGAIAALALVLYRLFGSLLGANLAGNAVSELSTPLGMLLAAGVVAAYHGLALRRDMARHDAAQRARAAEGAQTAPQPTASRRLVLSGQTGAEVEAALAALRDALPPGVNLDEG